MRHSLPNDLRVRSSEVQCGWPIGAAQLTLLLRLCPPGRLLGEVLTGAVTGWLIGPPAYTSRRRRMYRRVGACCRLRCRSCEKALLVTKAVLRRPVGE